MRVRGISDGGCVVQVVIVKASARPFGRAFALPENDREYVNGRDYRNDNQGVKGEPLYHPPPARPARHCSSAFLARSR